MNAHWSLRKLEVAVHLRGEGGTVQQAKQRAAYDLFAQRTLNMSEFDFLRQLWT